MSRYIDADTFDERVRISVGLVEEELTDDYKDGVRCTLEMLKTHPTADVVERKQGKWIVLYDEDSPQDGIWKCSACDYIRLADDIAPINYCPNCGADMRSE